MVIRYFTLSLLLSLFVVGSLHLVARGGPLQSGLEGSAQQVMSTPS